MNFLATHRDLQTNKPKKTVARGEPLSMHYGIPTDAAGACAGAPNHAPTAYTVSSLLSERGQRLR